MTTQPARPTPAAHAAASLLFTTVTLGSVITAVLAFTPLPWWLVVAPLWIPVAAGYLAITLCAAGTLAAALVRTDRGHHG